MAYNEKEEYKLIQERLDNNTFLSTPRNNKLLYVFLESKLDGGFGRIVYKNKCDVKTLVKKARNITKIDEYFGKDFDKIEEKDLLKYRNELNNDKIFCDQTIIEWDKSKDKAVFKGYKIVKTNKPLSFRTKTDYKQNFVEFYQFIMEYVYQEEEKEIKDITKYFNLQRPTYYNEIKVEFISDDDVMTLLNNIKNPQFKALVQLSLMSGARPCEILNIHVGKEYNLYKNKENQWVIHLPKIKRVSYKKFPFIIDMYEDELYPYFNNLRKNNGDKLFKMTNTTFRKLMNHYTTKYLSKAYSPKILRKTARMIRSNAGYSTDWINKLMGHSPGSNIQAHYLNYDGIKNEPGANEKLKAQQFPSLKKDYDNIKLQMQAQREQIEHMNKVLLAIQNQEKIKK